MQKNSEKTVSAWLFICCAMIFIMVVIGGVTRLTESGLSITEWKPITGIIPPIGAAQWEQEFNAYQKIPEYTQFNKGMTLDEYKNIYWWEYLHRLWGRLIGLAFALPLIYFWARGQLHREWKLPLVILFLLGLNQGFLGWYMVQSGLSVRTDVSQYRLTAHLTLAAIIYAYMFWIALHIRNFSAPKLYAANKIRKPAIALFGLFWVTFIMGGFMAGTNAGLAFRDFPQFNGQWWPDGFWGLWPWWANIFENPITIHALHRTLAVLSVVLGLALGFYAIAQRPPKSVKIPVLHVAGMGIVQMAIGISTIARGVPITLGAAHQAGAILLLTFYIWLLFAVRKN